MSATVAARGKGFWTRRMLPATRLGRIALRLMLVFVGWFVVNQSLVGLRESVEGVPVLVLILFGLAGLACGLAAGVVGLVAIVRKKERSLLVFASLLPGIMVIAFVLGEIFLPH